MTIGIIGGLGHRAGAAFYQELIARTPVAEERGHLPVVLVSDPALPDRIAHLDGRGPSPLPGLTAMVRRLEVAGARLICIASATAHAYLGELRAVSTVPLVNLLAETGLHIARERFRRIGVVATSATARLGLLEPYLEPPAELVYPDEATQHRVQQIIELLKIEGSGPPLVDELDGVLGAGWCADVDAILLGCTELHLVASSLTPTERPVIDAATVLADAVIREACTQSLFFSPLSAGIQEARTP